MKFIKQVNKLKQQLVIIFLAYKHPNTNLVAKFFALLTLCYGLSPIDLIPDFIPVLGYLDDVIILPLFIWISLKLLPDDIINECTIQAQDMWKDGKPKAWKYAIPFLLIWGIIIYFIYQYFV